MTDRIVVIAGIRHVFGDRLEQLAERLSVVTEADSPGYPGENAAVRELLADGVAGLRKIIDDRQGALTDAEIVGLEAIIVMEGRPALFIQGGDFFGVPALWQVLTGQREQIKSSIARVGRVEVRGHPALDWIGTGFLAGPRAIITNRHVAREFASTGWRDWQFRPGMSAGLDFNRELGATDPARFTVTGIAGIHDRYDLAVLAVEQTGDAGQPLPAPLPVATTRPGTVTGRAVYLVGYPAWDGTRNDAARMREIFRDVYDVKRLQPGMITTWADGADAFAHDCSTLGGNSGSPVFDLETHQVVGLHFSGQYLSANYAIPLWRLTGDDLLRKARVNFVLGLPLSAFPHCIATKGESGGAHERRIRHGAGCAGQDSRVPLRPEVPYPGHFPDRGGLDPARYPDGRDSAGHRRVHAERVPAQPLDT